MTLDPRTSTVTPDAHTTIHERTTSNNAPTLDVPTVFVSPDLSEEEEDGLGMAF